MTTTETRELAFYYPNPMWTHRDWVKNLVLFFDGIALLLVYLHGKIGSAMANQMRQTKSMSPQYAERWWDEHDLDPPDVDPAAFMKARLSWRYAKGTPRGLSGRMYLGNSIEKLERLRQAIEDGSRAKANVLFTSPPYRAITNYHYDQWLRLWLLGGPPRSCKKIND